VLAARQCIDVQTETQRILKLFKIAVKNANLCGKNMQYAHFAEICGKTRQSHIRVKLTGLIVHNEFILISRVQPL